MITSQTMKAMRTWTRVRRQSETAHTVDRSRLRRMGERCPDDTSDQKRSVYQKRFDPVRRYADFGELHCTFRSTNVPPFNVDSSSRFAVVTLPMSPPPRLRYKEEKIPGWGQSGDVAHLETGPKHRGVRIPPTVLIPYSARSAFDHCSLRNFTSSVARLRGSLRWYKSWQRGRYRARMIQSAAISVDRRQFVRTFGVREYCIGRGDHDFAVINFTFERIDAQRPNARVTSRNDGELKSGKPLHRRECSSNRNSHDNAMPAITSRERNNRCGSGNFTNHGGPLTPRPARRWFLCEIHGY